jgi:hypothetical protein
MPQRIAMVDNTNEWKNENRDEKNSERHGDGVEWRKEKVVIKFGINQKCKY